MSKKRKLVLNFINLYQLSGHRVISLINSNNKPFFFSCTLFTKIHVRGLIRQLSFFEIEDKTHLS